MHLQVRGASCRLTTRTPGICLSCLNAPTGARRFLPRDTTSLRDLISDVLMHLQVRGASCREDSPPCHPRLSLVLMHLQVRGASCLYGGVHLGRYRDRLNAPTGARRFLPRSQHSRTWYTRWVLMHLQVRGASCLSAFVLEQTCGMS